MRRSLLLASLALSSLLWGCGEDLVCGPGTVESGGSCVPVTDDGVDGVEELGELTEVDDADASDGPEAELLEDLVVEGVMVRGAVIDLEGAAVADARIFVVADAVIVTTATSDGQGQFTIGSLETGSVNIVASDGAGNGALRAANLVAGMNDVGLLVVQPLENIPAVVDVHGIGYEERLSTAQGNYLSPVYNDAVSEVYALRRIGGESDYRVVKLGLPSGEETVLVENEEVSTGYQSSLSLLVDRVLLYRSYRPTPDDPSTRTESDVFLDTQTGEELDSLAWWETHGGYHRFGSSFCFFEATQRQPAYDTIFGTAYEYRLRPACIDAATGDKRTGSVLTGWHTQLRFAVADDTSLAFIPRRDCDMSSPSCEWNPAQVLMSTELGTFQTRTVATLSGSASIVAEPDWQGDDLFVLDQATGDYVLSRLTMSTGALSPVASFAPMSDGYPYAISRVPGRDALLVHLVQGSGVTTSLGFFFLDTSNGQLSPIQRELSIDGASYTLCEGEYPRCGYEVGADGTIRLYETFADEEGQRIVLLTLNPDDSSTVSAFPIGESDYSLPPRALSPDGTHEVLALRDANDGFFQLHIGVPGTPLADYRKATFITANHTGIHFAADGDSVYYFTRDPISGFEQLFRVATVAP